MKWSFYQIWNESLEQRTEREMKPRNRIWASEMGGAKIDRYLKMKGTKPTNPPNPRSLRKFEAGNIWEAIIGYVLNRAGILQNRQEWLGYQYPGLLEVSGKLDFEAGGKPNLAMAQKTLSSEFNWLPPFITKATLAIVSRLNETFPDGLDNIVLELKSCSSFMFEKYEKNPDAPNHHKLQLFHYLKAKGMSEGHLVYVSKDDARLLEMGVLNPSSVENDYKKDIEEMTYYIKNGIEPKKEGMIDFDGKFFANWKIGYSQYLTMLYGFKTQKEFDDKYKPIVERWNRVLGRVAENKDMTKNNMEALDEMRKEGFGPMVQKFIQENKTNE